MNVRQVSDPRTLAFEIEQFYYYEASLLEAPDYKAWANILADDIVYLSPQTEFVDRRVNRSLDAIGAHSFDEDKTSILNRIGWLESGPTPETPPPLRQMLITNVRVIGEHDNGDVEAESKFLFWEMRNNGRNATFVGNRTDLLRRNGSGWLISRRKVFLASAILPKSPTNFF